MHSRGRDALQNQNPRVLREFIRGERQERAATSGQLRADKQGEEPARLCVALCASRRGFELGEGCLGGQGQATDGRGGCSQSACGWADWRLGW